MRASKWQTRSLLGRPVTFAYAGSASESWKSALASATGVYVNPHDSRPFDADSMNCTTCGRLRCCYLDAPHYIIRDYPCKIYSGVSKWLYRPWLATWLRMPPSITVRVTGIELAIITPPRLETTCGRGRQWTRATLEQSRHDCIL